MVKIIHKVTDTINKVFVAVSAAAMFAMLLVVFYSVVMRYVFNNSPAWGDELSRYLYVWIQLLGGAVCTYYMSHTSVSFLSDKLKGKARRVYMIITNLMFLLIGYLMVRYGWEWMMLNKDTLLAAMAPLTKKVVNFPIPMTGCVIILDSVRHIIDMIVDWNKTETSEMNAGREGIE